MANDVEVVTAAEKRAPEDESDLQSSRKKQKVVANSTDRNPTAVLNDLRNGLKYEILDQQGPPHAPVFTVAVIVDSQQYVGTGRSKKLAKSRAAENALKSFIQFPNNCKILSLNSDTTKVDFTSDAFEGSQNNTSDNESVKPNTQKNPIMLLNELYPSTKYEFSENATDIFSRFKVTVTVDNQTFIGTGSNKRRARQAGAMAALSKLLSNKPDEMQKYGISNYRPSNVTSEQQQWADNVARLVSEKFSSLMAQDALHARRKVLAGIVMNRDMQLEVISVATGTKCVSGEWLSMSGANLNDMHAEIISRRCLQLFLYDQLLMLTQPDKADKSIFEPNPDGPGYKLKAGIDFHLYINTAPCGDARIFCPTDKEIDRHPNRNSRGRLRAKIESGEGTVPVQNVDRSQNWDGIIMGERLLTMSCSDKIARWNVLGLQGCLLAHFIAPIYLKSIILGNLFNESHLYRAICGRIEHSLQGLSPPYMLNRPDMYLITSTEARHTARAPSFSVNWTIGQDQAEIVKASTGKPEKGISRVCKQIFARKFVEICKSGLIPVNDFKLSMLECYSDAKNVQSVFKSAKERLFEAFVKAGLGYWVQKPSEQDQFQLDYVEEKVEAEENMETEEEMKTEENMKVEENMNAEEKFKPEEKKGPEEKKKPEGKKKKPEEKMKPEVKIKAIVKDIKAVVKDIKAK